MSLEDFHLTLCMIFWKVQYHTKELLKFYILEEKNSLEELNKRITSFDYWQMRCLALILPFLIGEFIPEDDDHWRAFCTLLEIVRIVFSPVISKQQTSYLILIQTHHENVKMLYLPCFNHTENALYDPHAKDYVTLGTLGSNLVDKI